MLSKKIRIILLAIGIALSCGASVTTVESDVAWAHGAVCASADIRIMADFDAARANSCTIRNDKVRIKILPEVTPINPSPWYSFRIETASHKAIEVTLDYGDFKHRYSPKVSLDRKRWLVADENAVRIWKKGRLATFDVNVFDAPLYVSAQELFTYRDHRDWANAMTALRPYVRQSVLGMSLENREIIKLDARPANPVGTVMLVGRQHPPEVSGAVAFAAFVEEVFSDSELAMAFRDKFAVVAVPVVNPDGVDRGNWRQSSAGIDLNRDWGTFTQPETKLMRDELSRIDAKDNVALFLDFHSTFKNVLYTQTDDVETRPQEFATRWFAALTDKDPGFGLEREGGHNTDRPTSKAYVFGRFGAAAITYEMHEEFDRDHVRAFTAMAAREMMTILLEDSGSN